MQTSSDERTKIGADPVEKDRTSEIPKKTTPPTSPSLMVEEPMGCRHGIFKMIPLRPVEEGGGIAYDHLANMYHGGHIGCGGCDKAAFPNGPCENQGAHMDHGGCLYVGHDDDDDKII